MGSWFEVSGSATFSETYPIFIGDTMAKLTTGHGELDYNAQLAPKAGTANAFPHNVLAVTEHTISNNPYVSAVSFDPDLVLDKGSSDIETFKDLLDEFVNNDGSKWPVESDFQSFIEKASALFDEHGVDTTDNAEAEGTAHAKSTEGDFLRSVGRFLATAFALNQVGSTVVPFGIAALESDRLWHIELFKHRLVLAGRNAKNDFLIQAAQLMDRSNLQRLDLRRNLNLALLDWGKAEIMTKHTEAQQNTEWDVAEVQWNMETLKDAASINQSTFGAPMLAKGPSKLAQSLSQAFSVAPQVGMQVHQATGNPQAAVLAGLLGGAFAASGPGMTQ